MRNDDGSLTTTAYATPIHYRDGHGRFQPIESQLVADGDGPFRWRNKANSFTARFRDRFEGDYLRVGSGGREVGMALQGAAGAPPATVEGGRVRFPGVLPSVDLTYDLLSTGVKETLVIADRGAPPAFTFRLAAVDGAALVAERRATGRWDVRTAADDRLLFTLEPPRAREADPAGEELPDGAAHAAMFVTSVGAALDVTMTVDPVWFNAPERRFPVLLDPTVTLQPSLLDAVIDANCPTCSITTDNHRLDIGASDSKVWRAALQFDLGDIPSAATLTDAKLQTYFEEHCITTSAKVNCAQSLPHTINVHRMTGAWSASSTTQNMTFDATALSSMTVTTTDSAWLSWNVTQTVQNWVTGTQSNFGLLLKRSGEALGSAGIRPPGPSYSHEATLVPRLVVTYAGDGVDLLDPDTLHSNGAALRWAKYTGPSGAPFDRYEVHRSATARFTPSSSTLLTTIRDRNVTSYRDTTARATGTFSYRVVANTSPSNERRVTLPADGQATKTLQPDVGESADTYITKSSSFVNCHNNGKGNLMLLGASSSSTRRMMLRFDLRGIPVGAAVSSATMSMWHPDGRTDLNTINVHRLTRDWQEGSGVSTQCTGDGPTWYDVSGGVKWTAEGADFAATASASYTSTGTESHGWHDFTVTSLAQDWVDGDQPNQGVIVKLADETPGLYETLDYWSADQTVAPTLRPKLVIAYADGSHAVPPAVTVSAPIGGATARGAAVPFSASASDDRRVDKVEFLVDGTIVATDTTLPFGITWDSTTKANGSHTLAAKAYDDAGNSTTSSSVPVVVDNTGFPVVSLAAPTAGSYAAAVQADSPRAWWRLGETGGATAADASGNGHHGTYSGALPGATGALANDAGSAGSFPGNDNDDVVVTDRDALDFGTGDFTVEAWVKTAVNGERTIMGKYDGTGTTPNWRITVTDDAGLVGQIRVVISDVVTTRMHYGPHTRVDDGAWHHVAVVFERSYGTRIYVDGMEKATAGTVSGAMANGASLRIGDTSGYAALQGSIDEAAVYPAALTTARVQAHYDAGVVRGAYTVAANATDDGGVSKVEFYVDGVRFAEDNVAPYSVSLDTLSATAPVYDGVRSLTAKAYDAGGQVTTSAPVLRTVANAAHSRYLATYSTSALPASVVYDPALATQDKAGVDVTVTNKGNVTWPQADVKLRSRWVSTDSTPSYTDGPVTSLPSSVPGGASVTVRMLVDPPTLPVGVDQAGYRLRFDLYHQPTSTWFGSTGTKPSENPVIVDKVVSAGLGVEKFYQYEGEALGAGMTHLTNVASGNSLVTWSPFSSPGRGLSTVVGLTYNSLESGTDSPVGSNFSLVVSGLTRFGAQLDVHPNNADTIAGRANRWIAFTDGDGTKHRFEGKQATDGTVYWEEPAGVHLYLRQYSTVDPARKWAVTRPDQVTFFYDADGYPTSVEDANGNRLTFTLNDVDPGDDPGGPRKRITAITDAAGNGTPAATSRTYGIDYYTKDEVPKGRQRGKVQRITDHTGDALEFDYYEDGNLLRLTQPGGTKADGSVLDKRTFVFTYTTSSGDGPAIPSAAAREAPDPRTSPQSSRLYSVSDPRKNETRFAYYGPTSGQLRWKLASRIDRAGSTTSYSYNLVSRVTTVAAPLSRSTLYAYDAEGKVTGITNAKNETTTVVWTADRMVSRITEPTNAYVEFGYNANGYLTDRWDQLRNRTSLEYAHVAVDGNDVAGKWKAGRSVPHVSRLVKKTEPKGTATASPTTDFQWSFAYDTRGNLTSVTDPAAFTSTYVRNADGTVAEATDALLHDTNFTYEDSGLVSAATDARGKTTAFGYDADGLLLWVQDANHASYSGGNPREYRTYFDYDSFGRMGRQSTPKSTAVEHRSLLWAATEYDANDNAVLQVAPEFGTDYPASGARSTAKYDAMDRIELITGPDLSADPAGERMTFVYDAAGRLTHSTSPRGVQTAIPNDFTELLTYDTLDRVVKQTRHEIAPTGSITASLHTHYCFDLAGDLRRVTAPNAALATVDCAATTPPSHTQLMTYDVAHRPLTQKDPEGRTQSIEYDANGNVSKQTDAAGVATTVSYDQRDLPVTVVEPFVTGATPRNLTTKVEYDAVGNRKRMISPRAWDASSDKQNFSQYVTTMQYDEVNRLVRVDLPTSSAYPTPHYVHRFYDDVGNVTTSTLADESSALGTVPEEKTTHIQHFDPGWVRTTKEGTTPRIHFAYNAAGQQVTRMPEGADGRPDEKQAIVWSYFLDGPLKEQKDRNSHITAYAYDADNNLVSASGDSGVVDPKESRLAIEAGYDGFNRITKARARKQTESNWRFTATTYDNNGNVKTREDDGVETGAGALVTSGRSAQFDYDGADWLTTMTDRGATSAATDDQLVQTTFWPTGRERERKISKAVALGSWVLKQKTNWDYFANGKLKTMSTANGVGSVLESHTVGYDDPAGIYVNGNRTKDTFTLVGPNTAAACRSTSCTATYAYDARDRLVQENNGHGSVTNLTVDAAGNVTDEEITRAGGMTTETLDYSGNRLTRTSGVGDARRYWYDSEGNLDCTTRDNGSAADCNPTTGGTVSPKLLADYHYDYLNRLDGFRSFSTNGTTSTKDDTSDYVLDALNRVVEQTESHGATGAPRTTAFGYVGLTTQLSRETHKTSTGTVTATKSYAYDAFGHRVTMTNDPGAPGATGGVTEDFSYGYDVHGSVSLLLSNTTSSADHGSARAAYAYRPYGDKDSDLTQGDTNDDDPFNPYRYTAKRWDSGSGSLDMGARRFGPDAGRFLQRDQYHGALADLGLSADPLTGNRWSLAGGNPLNYIEVDGHKAQMDGTGGAGTLTADQVVYNEMLAGQAAGASRKEQKQEYKIGLDTAWERFMGGVGWVEDQNLSEGHCFRWGCEAARRYFYANQKDADVVARSIEIGLNYCVDNSEKCERKDLIAQIGTDVLAAAFYQGVFTRFASAAAGSRVAPQTTRYVIGGMEDLGPGSLRAGEAAVASRLPGDAGNRLGNWLNNRDVLRSIMREGRPIRDASVDSAGNLLHQDTRRFITLERDFLRSNRWTYDPSTQLWMPPG